MDHDSRSWQTLNSDGACVRDHSRNKLSQHDGYQEQKTQVQGKTINHVDVVETNQPSETASTMSAIESGDADESMNMVKLGHRGMATDTQSIRAERYRNDQWVTLSRPR